MKKKINKIRKPKMSRTKRKKKMENKINKNNTNEERNETGKTLQQQFSDPTYRQASVGILSNFELHQNRFDRREGINFRIGSNRKNKSRSGTDANVEWCDIIVVIRVA